MSYVLVFLLGLLLGLMIAGSNPSTASVILCPHGYKEWDECPDCRH